MSPTTSLAFGKWGTIFIYLFLYREAFYIIDFKSFRQRKPISELRQHFKPSEPPGKKIHIGALVTFQMSPTFRYTILAFFHFGAPMKFIPFRDILDILNPSKLSIHNYISAHFVHFKCYKPYDMHYIEAW